MRERKNFFKGLVMLLFSLMLMWGLSTTVFAGENEVLKDVDLNMAANTDGAPVMKLSATTSSITFKWTKNYSGSATLGLYKSSEDVLVSSLMTTQNTARFTNLKAGTYYRLLMVVGDQAYAYVSGIGTVNSKMWLSSKSWDGNKCYFSIKVQDTCSGVQFKAYNTKTKKTSVNKNITELNFSATLKKNVVYKITMKPYTTVNGVKKYGKTLTTYTMSAPAYVSGKALTNTSARITWKKTSGVTGYYVYLRKPGSSSFTKMATTKSTSYVIKNMKKYKEYGFCVVAYKKVGSKVYKSENGVNRSFYFY